MRSVTFKWIILSSALVISLIIASQLYWLNKQYNLEEKEFTTNVVKSIRGLYEDFDIYSRKNLYQSIEMPNKNAFLFRLDTILPKEALIDSLRSELEQSNVFTDCKVALYDARSATYLYELYVPAATSHFPEVSGVDLPRLNKNYNYVYLFFPHWNIYILGQMTWWILSGVILIIVLISFAISLFYLYRQKFLNEVQNDFIRNVTHEFQTPLTTLTVGLDIISKSNIIEHPEKLAKYTRLMQGQTDYLKHHIENLMKVLKTEATGLVMEKTAVAPNELIKNAIAQLYAVIEEKQARIELRLENNNTAIPADSNNLYVSIVNIISNAIKYSPHPRVIIETSTVNGTYIISVKDNGIGIDKRYQKKLFKKFYRVPTGDVHNVKGLGLGLYFVKKVIDAHKGTITINSIAGIGTEFIIELPKH